MKPFPKELSSHKLPLQAGPSLKPYSVDGALCEFGWTELYQCNNGGGLRGTGLDNEGEPKTSMVTCRVTVETGLTDEKTKNDEKGKGSVGTAKSTKTTDVDKTTVVDNKFNAYVQESFGIGFEVPVVKDLFSLGAKVSQSYSWEKDTQNTVSDKVKVRLSFTTSISRAPRADTEEFCPALALRSDRLAKIQEIF